MNIGYPYHEFVVNNKYKVQCHLNLNRVIIIINNTISGESGAIYLHIYEYRAHIEWAYTSKYPTVNTNIEEQVKIKINYYNKYRKCNDSKIFRYLLSMAACVADYLDKDILTFNGTDYTTEKYEELLAYGKVNYYITYNDSELFHITNMKKLYHDKHDEYTSNLHFVAAHIN